MKDYEEREVAKIIEYVYPDGTIAYIVENHDEHGEGSVGMLTQMEVLIELLVLMGKIDRPNVYQDRVEPKSVLGVEMNVDPTMKDGEWKLEKP